MSEIILSPEGQLRAIKEMVDNTFPPEIINEQIKKWKLPLKLQGGKLVDIGVSTKAWLDRFITENPKMEKLKSNVGILSKTDDVVLLTGETGTGKELLARALHGDSREGRFIAVNCAGLPETLIESIMFGHAKGAFTGALSEKEGLMKVANKGTFFLDEVSELPLMAQGKFLRAIQEKAITPVGSDKEIPINCRIVCATNKDLRKMVDNDKFRIDLYARISVFELETIPLRERPEDIVLIVKSLEGGQEMLDALNKGQEHFNLAANLNTEHNVRSLQKYVRRYIVLRELPTI